MNPLIEYLALAAFLSPVAVLLAMNLWLVALGEEGSLLFPSLRPYPVVLPPKRAEATSPAPLAKARPAIEERDFAQVACTI